MCLVTLAAEKSLKQAHVGVWKCTVHFLRDVIYTLNVQKLGGYFLENRSPSLGSKCCGGHYFLKLLKFVRSAFCKSHNGTVSPDTRFYFRIYNLYQYFLKDRLCYFFCTTWFMGYFKEVLELLLSKSLLFMSIFSSSIPLSLKDLESCWCSHKRVY